MSLSVPASPLNYFARVLSGLLVIVIGLWWSGAYDDHLKKGVEAVRLTLTARTRVRNEYLKTYPDGGKPSDFIRYLEGADESGPQDYIWPRMPSGVTLTLKAVDKKVGDQVVLTSDDENQILIVEGYRKPYGEPKYVDDVDFDEVFADRSKYAAGNSSAPPPEPEEEFWADGD